MLSPRPPWALAALLAASCAEAPPPPAAPPMAAVATAAPAPPTQAELDAEVAKGDERYQAKDFAGALTLLAGAWEKGARKPAVAYNAACAAALDHRLPEAFSWLDRAIEAGLTTSAWAERDPDFAELRKDPRFDAFRARVREANVRRAQERHVGEGLTPSTPEAEGIDPKALAKLLAEAEKSATNALAIAHDGKLVGAWYFGGGPQKIEAMSATKSIVALAVGAAIDDGKIPSLDTPVWRWFPEWKQGKKQRITLAMLLNHTSGLQAGATTEEIYASPDFVRLALAAELTDEPGAKFFYNNKAVNLLPEIVARATGQSFQEYVKQRLFGRLGIEDIEWTEDRAGHPHGMSGLQIHALDLAKIGQMMLDGGTWKGQRVISAAFLDKATHPAQPFEESCGLLFWLRAERDDTTLPKGSLREASKHGLPKTLLEKLAPFEGKPLATRQFWKQLNGAMSADERKAFWASMGAAKRSPARTTSEPFGYEAEGYLGQTMLVIPKAKLVAVRMTLSGASVPQDVQSFAAFDDLVLALPKR